MKKYISYILLIAVLSGCSKTGDTSNQGNGNNPPPIGNPPGPDDVQISSISRLYGYTGDRITVSGKNFGADPAAITAKINNVVTTIFPSSLSGAVSVDIKVPAKCGTGPITLTRAGKTATGPSFFYMPSVTVTTMYGKYNTQGFVNGNGTDMRFGRPSSMVFDKNNNIYVIDGDGAPGLPGGAMIRKINSSGQISTFSGGPLDGSIPNNTNVSWTTGLPANVNTSVNGGAARFNRPTGINISSDQSSDAFKLFVSQNSFVRIINEATATGVFAGNPYDTIGQSSGPKTGGRHEAHVNPIGPIMVFRDGSDYGSPTLFWFETGGPARIVKQDVNGNISTLLELTNTPGNYLAQNTDGTMFLHGLSGVSRVYKLTQAGVISNWLDGTDSVLNRASGKKELYIQVDAGQLQGISVDKDGNLLLLTGTSAGTSLCKIFPDKSFLRLFQWTNRSTTQDGINDNARVSASQIVVRDNGDVWFIDGFTIRKMTFE